MVNFKPVVLFLKTNKIHISTCRRCIYTTLGKVLTLHKRLPNMIFWSSDQSEVTWWFEKSIWLQWDSNPQTLTSQTSTQPFSQNGWVFLYELSGCGFKSCCSHLNFRYHACFEQGVPWHSGNWSVISLWNKYVTW